MSKGKKSRRLIRRIIRARDERRITVDAALFIIGYDYPLPQLMGDYVSVEGIQKASAIIEANK